MHPTLTVSSPILHHHSTTTLQGGVDHLLSQFMRLPPESALATLAARLDNEGKQDRGVNSNAGKAGSKAGKKKAASSMKLLFTMVALRVVLAQEEGFGNECHDGRGGGASPHIHRAFSRSRTLARVYFGGQAKSKWKGVEV